jgi:hypothetical protein
LYNRSSLCPRVFFRSWLLLFPLGSTGGCSLASLACSDAAFLSIAWPFLYECALPGLKQAIFPIIWSFVFCAFFVLCVLVYLPACLIGSLLHQLRAYICFSSHSATVARHLRICANNVSTATFHTSSSSSQEGLHISPTAWEDSRTAAASTVSDLLLMVVP